MRELREAGTTLLFVSHDMSSIRDLCQKALYLKAGEADFWGESSKAINYYFNETTLTETTPRAMSPALPKNFQAAISPISQSYLERLKNEAVWWFKETPHDKDAYILGVGTYNEEGRVSEKITMSKKLKVKILLVSLIQQNYYLSVTFKNKIGILNNQR